MKYAITALVSFGLGVLVARIWWTAAIAKGKEEIAKIEAAVASRLKG